jgi:hypothetical protein
MLAIASSIEPVQYGRIHAEMINLPFLRTAACLPNTAPA